MLAIVMSAHEPRQTVGADRSSGGARDPIYTRSYYERSLHRGHWFRNNRRKYALRWSAIKRMVEPSRNDVVLDVGCATGEHAIRLAPYVARVIGIDNASEAIACAMRRVACAGNVEFIHADATRLDAFRDEMFDKAMAIDFLEHVNDDALDLVQREVWRVLKPGGTFAIYTPCGSHYVERMKARGFILRQIPGHVAVRDERGFTRMVAASSWQVREQFILPSTYPVFGWIDRVAAPWPIVGRWFRFRLCLVLEKARVDP